MATSFWLEWKDPDKIWVGSGNPCGKTDMAIFYASTTITVGNGAKTHFWCAPWLHGRAPIDVAPLIYEASKRKKCTVAQALAGSAWVRNITLATPLSPDFISQFVELWRLARNFQLLEEEVDDIT
jgi:hypothetical protein